MEFNGGIDISVIQKYFIVLGDSKLSIGLLTELHRKKAIFYDSNIEKYFSFRSLKNYDIFYYKLDDIDLLNEKFSNIFNSNRSNDKEDKLNILNSENFLGFIIIVQNDFDIFHNLSRHFANILSFFQNYKTIGAILIVKIQNPSLHDEELAIHSEWTKLLFEIFMENALEKIKINLNFNKFDFSKNYTNLKDLIKNISLKNVQSINQNDNLEKYNKLLKYFLQFNSSCLKFYEEITKNEIDNFIESFSLCKDLLDDFSLYFFRDFFFDIYNWEKENKKGMNLTALSMEEKFKNIFSKYNIKSPKYLIGFINMLEKKTIYSNSERIDYDKMNFDFIENKKIFWPSLVLNLFKMQKNIFKLKLNYYTFATLRNYQFHNHEIPKYLELLKDLLKIKLLIIQIAGSGIIAYLGELLDVGKIVTNNQISSNPDPDLVGNFINAIADVNILASETNPAIREYKNYKWLIFTHKFFRINIFFHIKDFKISSSFIDYVMYFFKQFLKLIKNKIPDLPDGILEIDSRLLHNLNEEERECLIRIGDYLSNSANLNALKEELNGIFFKSMQLKYLKKYVLNPALSLDEKGNLILKNRTNSEKNIEEIHLTQIEEKILDFFNKNTGISLNSLEICEKLHQIDNNYPPEDYFPSVLDLIERTILIIDTKNANEEPLIQRFKFTPG
ncbi:MAG: hypothetical protein ACTSRZ_09370 [Promethearchaeota archaeon]